MSYKEKTDADLIKELGVHREELRGLRFNVAGSKVRNVKQAKGLRKEIARILTEVNRRTK
jgi:ribosomal protein L29